MDLWKPVSFDAPKPKIEWESFPTELDKYAQNPIFHYDLRNATETPTFLVLDTETTGLSKSDVVLSIGWIVGKLDGNIQAARHFIVKQKTGFAVDSASVATSVHGLKTDWFEKHGKPWTEIVDQLLTDLQLVQCIGGHNMPYDRRLIFQTFGRNESSLQQKLFKIWESKVEYCTKRISTRRQIQANNNVKVPHGLSDVFCRLFPNHHVAQYHCALFDAFHCFQVLCCVGHQVGLPALEQLNYVKSHKKRTFTESAETCAEQKENQDPGYDEITSPPNHGLVAVHHSRKRLEGSVREMFVSYWDLRMEEALVRLQSLVDDNSSCTHLEIVSVPDSTRIELRAKVKPLKDEWKSSYTELAQPFWTDANIRLDSPVQRAHTGERADDSVQSLSRMEQLPGGNRLSIVLRNAGDYMLLVPQDTSLEIRLNRGNIDFVHPNDRDPYFRGYQFILEATEIDPHHIVTSCCQVGEAPFQRYRALSAGSLCNNDPIVELVTNVGVVKIHSLKDR